MATTTGHSNKEHTFVIFTVHTLLNNVTSLIQYHSHNNNNAKIAAGVSLSAIGSTITEKNSLFCNINNIIVCVETFMSYHQPGSGTIVETKKNEITSRN